MELSWVKLPCDRCGGERIAKRPCSECGAPPAPHEIQPDLDRRQRVLDNLRASRQTVTPNTRPDDVSAATSAAFTLVQTALGAAAGKSRDASQLIEAFEVVDQVEADLSIPLLRPHLNTGRRLHAGFAKAREGLELFADSLGASSLEEAQHTAAAGQTLIDSGLDELEPTRHDVVSEQAEAGVSLLETLGAAHADPVSLNSFAHHGRRLAQVTGLPEGDIGLLIAIEGLDVATSSLDRQRVLRLTDVAEKALAKDPRGLDDIDLRDEMLAALLQVDARVAALSNAIESEESDLTLVSTALDLVTTVRERGLKVAMMPLIAARGELSLSDLRQKKTGEVLKLAERLFPELELAELDRSLRDGAAHGDFRIEKDLIVFDRGTLRLTAEELADRILAVTEYFTGTIRGVLVTMARTGRTLPEPSQLPPRLRLEVMRYLLSIQGITESTFKYQEDRAILEAVGEVASWSTLVAAVTPLLPPSTMTLEASFTTSSGPSHHGWANVDAFRSFADRDPGVEPYCCTNALACMPVLAATRFDGQNPLDDDSWLKLAIHLVSEHFADESLLVRLRRGKRACDLAALADVPTGPIEALLTRTRKTQEWPATTVLRSLRYAPLPNSANAM